jgi:hypothetical protein
MRKKPHHQYFLVRGAGGFDVSWGLENAHEVHTGEILKPRLLNWCGPTL